MRRILELNLLVGLMLFGSVFYINGQNRQRIINELYLPKDAPVQIIGRELEGRKFEDRRRDKRISGVANSDWIKHLTFEVKNVSKKNVSYIRITLTVPQQKQMPGEMVYEVSFGSRNGTDGLISPGETAKIKVRENDFLFWEKRFKDWGVDDFDHVFLELRTIYFDDGTGWSLGREIIQDPLNPRKWIRVDQPKPNLNSRKFFLDWSFYHPSGKMPDFFCCRQAPRLWSVDGGSKNQMLVNARVVQIQ